MVIAHSLLLGRLGRDGQGSNRPVQESRLPAGPYTSQDIWKTIIVTHQSSTCLYSHSGTQASQPLRGLGTNMIIEPSGTSMIIEQGTAYLAPRPALTSVSLRPRPERLDQP
jgi:hypothetical protein